jgi:hypothetical protein
VKTTTGDLKLSDHIDHFLARWRVNRGGHRVEPGLYALGAPKADSPVFVSANYTLSFDELRSALKNLDCYILVLDTKGINVWCAAGKGTFGTDEIVRRVEESGLAGVVTHRRLVVPQLGAPGVAAHEVKRRTGFRVLYGPVRARDLREYLRTGEATPQMRQVRFTARDRLVLIPVELVGVLPFVLAAAVLLFAIGGALAASAAVASALAGVLLFPILLPWIPTPNFATKGLLLGAAVAAPFVVLSLAGDARAAGAAPWLGALGAAPYALMMPPVTAYLSLNFTGSTPFTSKSGVRREIFRYAAPIAWTFAGGGVLAIALAIATALRGS